MISTRIIRKIGLLAACVLLVATNLDAQKQLESIVTYYYPTEGDSVNGVKIINEYDEADRMTSHSIYSWDANAKRWEGSSFPCEECMPNPGRFEYVYNEDGNRVLVHTFVWMGRSAGWVERSRSENGFDESGRLATNISSVWDESVGELTDRFKMEYGYDEDGHMIYRVANSMYPPLTTWRPFEKMIYAFDAEGRKDLEIRQKWVDSTSTWVNQNKTEWNFDTVGIRTDIIAWNWGLVNNEYDWKENNTHKIENVFDSTGNRILTTDFLKTSATRWSATYKEELEYNAMGKPILSVISKGYPALKEELRTEWAYDESGRLTLETQTGSMVRRDGPLPLKNKLRVFRSFDPDGDVSHEIWNYWDGETKTYLSAGKDYYFYHTTSSGKTETLIDPIRIYPNPTNGILYLSGLSKSAGINIYSLQGRLLRSIQNVDFSIDLSGLSPGAYLIVVTEVGRPPFRTMLIKE